MMINGDGRMSTELLYNYLSNNSSINLFVVIYLMFVNFEEYNEMSIYLAK